MSQNQLCTPTTAQLQQTKYGKAISLKKQPYLNLGSVKLSSENITLTDFTGDSA